MITEDNKQAICKEMNTFVWDTASHTVGPKSISTQDIIPRLDALLEHFM
jgi:hypothetical protein